ncbi:unnamed protein product, partial [Prorocentrum cordatum]
MASPFARRELSETPCGPSPISKSKSRVFHPLSMEVLSASRSVSNPKFAGFTPAGIAPPRRNCSSASSLVLRALVFWRLSILAARVVLAFLMEVFRWALSAITDTLCAQQLSTAGALSPQRFSAGCLVRRLDLRGLHWGADPQAREWSAWPWAAPRHRAPFAPRAGAWTCASSGACG